MSIAVMTWVWRHGPKDPTERLVLLAIADHADDAGECYPSMARIAEKGCVTERGARGIVRRLETGGWISTKVGGGRGGKSRYTVLMTENPERETGNVKPGIKNREPETRNEGAAFEGENPERGDTKPGTSVPPNHHRTINKKERTPLPPKGGERAILCEVMSEQAADDFIAHRKAKRAKLTERAAQMIANDLRGHHDPDEVVRLSVKNGWTGIFPERVPSPAKPAARLFDLTKYKG